MTKQPNWEFVAQLGDANPILHGGYFIYRDLTKVYADEGEYVEPYKEVDNEIISWRIWRFSLDKLKQHKHPTEDRMLLICTRYRANWPHPVEGYDEWFNRDISGLASFGGQTPAELREAFCSDNIIERARAYELVGKYHGFLNLDGYPLIIDGEGANDIMWKRYEQELCKHRHMVKNEADELFAWKCADCDYVYGRSSN
jgi:hypothetical protein